jgi:hypothetical protein
MADFDGMSLFCAYQQQPLLIAATQRTLEAMKLACFPTVVVY